MEKQKSDKLIFNSVADFENHYFPNYSFLERLAKTLTSGKYSVRRDESNSKTGIINYRLEGFQICDKELIEQEVSNYLGREKDKYLVFVHKDYDIVSVWITENFVDRIIDNAFQTSKN